MSKSFQCVLVCSSKTLECWLSDLLHSIELNVHTFGMSGIGVFRIFIEEHESNQKEEGFDLIFLSAVAGNCFLHQHSVKHEILMFSPSLLCFAI